MALPTFADQSIEITWNRSASPDVVGYNVYYGGVNASCTNEISVGNLTNLKVTGLAEGTTFFFVITSVNSSGTESDYSSPMYYSVPTKTANLGTPSISSCGVSIPVNGLPGHFYVVQVSTNLVDWTSVETNLTPLLITDSNSVHCDKRFYRAVYLY